MLEIMRVDPTGRTPVLDGGGRRLGTVVDADGDATYVSVNPDAPADALEALGWDADADRARLPDALAEEDADAVRLAL